MSTPDALRTMPGLGNARNPLFDVVNTGKKLAICDLNKPVQLDAFQSLVASTNDFWLTRVRFPQPRKSS